MKKVFQTSSEVIHLFAQRTQKEGRCSNVYFNDINHIYSYVSHYLLGEFKEIKKEMCIIINDSGYSVTTSKHISEITFGTRQYKQIFYSKNRPKNVLSELKDLAYKLQNARKPEKYTVPANELYNNFIKDLDYTKNAFIEDKESIKEVKKIIAIFNTKDIKKYFEDQAQRILKDQDKHLKEVRTIGKKAFSFWLESFESHLDQWPENIERVKMLTDKQTKLGAEYKTGLNEDFIRLSKDLQNVETTQNVKIPVKDAVKLYKAILGKQDIKGYNINGYTVISINGTLKIGCHNINMDSVNKIGQKILEITK